MKNKFKKLIVLIITIICIASCTLTTVFARGGGGGGGSSSSGGGSSSSHSYSGRSSTYNGRSSGSGGMLTFIIFTAFIYAAKKKKSISAYINTYRVRHQALSVIKKIESGPSQYLYNRLDNDISEAYYNLQEAWTKRNITICENNLSSSLKEYYESKLEWMIIKHELNVLNKVKLLQSIPVSVRHLRDNSMDKVWVFINGSMIDYTINETSGQIINGSRRNKLFIEFWQFKVENNKWVLNKILQEDEFDFNRCEAYIENGDNDLLKD